MFETLGKLVVFIAGAFGLAVFFYFLRKQDATDAKKYYANLMKSFLLGGLAFVLSLPIVIYFGIFYFR